MCYRYPSLLVDAITSTTPGAARRGQERHGQRRVLPGALSRRAADAGVLMLESLSQVAAMLLLQREDAPPNARVYLRGVNDAKFRRRSSRRSAAARDLARPARAVAGAAQAAAYRRRPGRRGSRAAARLVADETEIDPTAIVARARADRRGHDDRPHATIGPNVRIGANCRIGASAIDRRLDRDRRRLRDLPVRVDRPGAAGPQVPRRADAACRSAAATSSASSSPSTAARRAAAA
jgi:hypothetical protein